MHSRRYVFSNYIYALLLLILSLKAINFYPLRNTNTLYLILVLFIIGVMSIDRYKIKISDIPILLSFLIYFFFNAVKYFNFGSVLPLLVYLPLILMSDDKKSVICSIYVNTLSSFVLISLLFWILYLLGVNLSSTSIDVDGRVLTDYGFFLRNHEIIPRFQSLFMEPGHLGTISALVVYLNKFNIRTFSGFTFLMAAIFSLSLASYLLLFIGYIISIISFSKNKIYFLRYLVVFSLFITVIANYSINNEDSILYQKVFSRLEFQDGKLAGNNRYSSNFETYYDTQMNSSQVALLGMGNRFNFDDFPGNAGYKVYVIVNGIISTFLLFIMYWSLAVPSKSMYVYGLLFLNVLSFIQRAYGHTYFFIILFILSLSYMNKVIKLNRSV